MFYNPLFMASLVGCGGVEGDVRRPAADGGLGHLQKQAGAVRRCVDIVDISHAARRKKEKVLIVYIFNVDLPSIVILCSSY